MLAPEYIANQSAARVALCNMLSVLISESTKEYIGRFHADIVPSIGNHVSVCRSFRFIPLLDNGSQCRGHSGKNRVEFIAKCCLVWVAFDLHQQMFLTAA